MKEIWFSRSQFQETMCINSAHFVGVGGEDNFLNTILTPVQEIRLLKDWIYLKVKKDCTSL